MANKPSSKEKPSCDGRCIAADIKDGFRACPKEKLPCDVRCIEADNKDDLQTYKPRAKDAAWMITADGLEQPQSKSVLKP